MSDHLFFVLSRPPESISASEYHRWYARHVREIIEGPSFAAARRYRIDASGDPPCSQASFSHLALYEYDGDLQTMQAGLQARISSGEVFLPPWFDQIVFRSWDAIAIDERAEAASGKGS